MLEVLYETGTREVRAWCGDPEQFGGFTPKAGQAVVVFPVEVKDIPRGENYMVDLEAETVYPATPHVPPPDYRQEWKDAKTTAQKLKVIERKEGWNIEG